MDYKSIIYQKENGIAVITFNRPDKRNALNEEMMNEIDAALYAAEKDGEIFSIILTGGSKYFISGTDMDFLLGQNDTLTPQIMYELHYKTQGVYRHLSVITKPAIAAIGGYAFGGGLELALCCDFRIAAENARMGTPEIKLGIVPGAGGTQRLTRMIGITKAKELVMTGEPVSANEAYQLGMINKVVPDENLLKESIEFAGKFRNLPSFAVSIAKSVIDNGINMGLREGLELERFGFSMLYSTEDQEEGLKAFLEKRPPKFK